MQHRTVCENPKSVTTLCKVCLGSIALYYSSRVLFVVVALALIAGSPAQDAFTRAGDSSVSSASPSREVMNHVIDGLKEAEHAQYLYERIERVETRKQAGDADPQSVRISRVIPAGTGMAKIPLGLDGNPRTQTPTAPNSTSC
jgi:hypothetical protein